MNHNPAIGVQQNISDTLTTLDLQKLKDTPLNSSPFTYIVIESFVKPDAFEAATAAFPVIRRAGSFPLDRAKCQSDFLQLIKDLESDVFRQAIEAKFNIDLKNRPLMITLRGMCAAKHGAVHTDTDSKIISLLLYMNENWEHTDAGKLRLLRSRDISDYVAEVPPSKGAIVIFKRSEKSWHGHTSFSGVRKVIQLNWVTEQKFADRNLKRHWWTAMLKKLLPEY